MFDGA